MQNRKTYISYEYMFFLQKLETLKIIPFFFVIPSNFRYSIWKINIFALLTGFDAQLLFSFVVSFLWRKALRKWFSAGKCVSAVHWDRKSTAVTRPLARAMPCFFVALYTLMLAATLVQLTLTVYRRNFSHAVARTVAGFDAVPKDLNVSLGIFMYLSKPVEKIHKDT